MPQVFADESEYSETKTRIFTSMNIKNQNQTKLTIIRVQQCPHLSLMCVHICACVYIYNLYIIYLYILGAK